MLPTPLISDARLAEYVLGLLPEEEAEPLDQASIVDDEFAARLAVVEHELFDAYVAGELTAERRERFELVFLASADGQRRVEIARRLAKGSLITPAREGGSATDARWWIAAAASVLLAVATVSWLFQPVPQSQAQAPVAVEPPTPAAPPTPSQTPPAVVALFLLSPSGTRSASSSPPVVIPPDARLVTLRLVGDPGADRLTTPFVVIETVEGRGVFRAAAQAVGPAADGALAEVAIESALLPPDDYVVQLFPAERGREDERIRYFLRVRNSQ